MMFKNFFTTSLLLVPFTLAAMAEAPLATPAKSNLTHTIHADINLGYGRVDIDTSEIDSRLVTARKSSVVALMNVGAKLNNTVGVELGAVSLPTFKLSSGRNSVSVNSNALTGGARVEFPISEKWQFFGRGGYAYVTETLDIETHEQRVEVDDNETVSTGYLGFGLTRTLNDRHYFSLQAFTTLKNGEELPATYSALIGFGFRY